MPGQADGQSGIARCNCVALFGTALGLLSLWLPWLSVRSSRLAEGDTVSIWSALGMPVAGVFLVLWLIALRASFDSNGERAASHLGVAGALLAPATLLAAGLGSTHLLESAEPFARSSLSAGVWIGLVASYVLIHTAARSLTTHRRLRSAIVWAPILVVAIAGLAGAYGDTSIAREFAGNESRFIQEMGRHISLSLGSVAIGTCIAVPLGVAAARNKRVERPVFVVTSAIETIPSLALFGLMIAPLSAVAIDAEYFHAHDITDRHNVTGVFDKGMV